MVGGLHRRDTGCRGTQRGLMGVLLDYSDILVCVFKDQK